MSTNLPTSTRRVLHVFGGLHLGGAEIWTARASDALEAAGWQVDFCLLDPHEGPLAERMRLHGRHVLRCASKPLGTFPMRFGRLLRRGSYAVVHSHVLLFGGVICAVAAAAGVPARLVHLHNCRDGRGDSACRRGYRAAMRAAIRRFAAASLAVSDAARDFGGGRAAWLPCGIDLTPFSEPVDDSMRAGLGLRPRAFVVGHAARLAPAKNQALLLEAFARARPDAASNGIDLQLAIAGDGPLRDRLERQARTLGAARDVAFLGARDDVPRLMTSVFDAVAMPSLHEGLPLAAIEAQAAGLPCLFSDRIGRQTDAVPGLVERLPLEAGASGWAAALTRLPLRPRLDRTGACAAIRRAGLDLESTSSRLVAIYAAQYDAAQRRSGIAA